ncbi:MAG: hypothetical protein V4725_02630 [Bacteroidota bacterium]
MKKSIYTLFAVMLTPGLLLPGCRKDEAQSSCRLIAWQGLDDGYLRTLAYNDRGLLSEWKETSSQFEVNQTSAYIYNENKKLEKVDFYNKGVLEYTIDLVYQHGRIEKEIWYVGNTEVVDDTVVNTYNSKKQLVKRESLLYGYYAAFTLDAMGNATRLDVNGSDGTRFQTEILEFNKPVKEPMRAVPGMPYPVQYINYSIDALKYTYYRGYYFDENGVPIDFYELDREKSVPLNAGTEGYAIFYNTFDNVSQLYNRQVWQYDNCDKKSAGHKAVSKALTPRSSTATKMQRRRLITVPEMKELVKSRRMGKQ